MTKTWKFLWAGWLTAFAVLEGIALMRKALGDTLSENTRDFFHTDTLVGRSTWAICWSLFSGLFMAHILNKRDTFWD